MFISLEAGRNILMNLISMYRLIGSLRVFSTAIFIFIFIFVSVMRKILAFSWCLTNVTVNAAVTIIITVSTLGSKFKHSIEAIKMDWRVVQYAQCWCKSYRNLKKKFKIIKFYTYFIHPYIEAVFQTLPQLSYSYLLICCLEYCSFFKLVQFFRQLFHDSDSWLNNSVKQTYFERNWLQFEYSIFWNTNCLIKKWEHYMQIDMKQS